MTKKTKEDISDLAELLMRCLDTPSRSRVGDLKNVEGALLTAYNLGFVGGLVRVGRKKKK